MRILVYPHDMALGGSQLNAIELAAAVRDLGHEVTVAGVPDVLVEFVKDLGLPFTALRGRPHPSTAIAWQIARLVDRLDIDLVHGYEWPPALEGALGSRLASRGAVGTVMSMALAPFLPRSMPLVVGTHEIARSAVHLGLMDVHVIEPPVDVRNNSMGATEPLARTKLGVCEDPDVLVLAIVSRIVPELKLEGLLSACDAVAELNRAGKHTHLIVAGDGPARPDVESAAASAANAAGHPVVHLLGQLADPRPAYAAADVVLGMGGSAIRGLAFGKPLVVQGERGFWSRLTPSTVETFLESGWYGIGPAGQGRPEGARNLATELGPLRDPALRGRLGVWGRELAENRYSLEAAARMQEAIYSDTLTRQRPIPRRELASSYWGAFKHMQGRRVRSKFAHVPHDDFNALKNSPVR